MVSNNWWLVPLLVLIGGFFMAWYSENHGYKSSTGYFSGVNFILWVVCTVLVTLSLVIGHYL